jgi:DNA invertase Pin-like site-specific DNA recombinase
VIRKAVDRGATYQAFHDFALIRRLFDWAIGTDDFGIELNPCRRLNSGSPRRKDASKRRFDIVMAWAIDRLGRSLIDLLGTIQTLEACGVDLYLDQQAIDTATPAGRLMFQVTGAFAEFERSMIRQRVHAGLKRAVGQGKQLGRPKASSAIETRIQRHLRAKTGILKVARECGVGTGTVQRIKRRWTRDDDYGVPSELRYPLT